MRDADLIVAIGPRLGEMTTGGYELLVPPKARQQLVHIHAGAEELGRVYAPDLAINASMACAAPALATLDAPTTIPLGGMDARRRTPTTRPTSCRRRSRRSTWPRSCARSTRNVPDDTIFTNGAGNFSGWLHRFHRYAGLRHAGRTQLAPTSGAMGYGVPAAVAAALLRAATAPSSTSPATATSS